MCVITQHIDHVCNIGTQCIILMGSVSSDLMALCLTHPCYTETEKAT